MAALTLPTFLSTLQTNLVARLVLLPSFDEVKVWLVDPGDQTTIEAVTLVRAFIPGQQTRVAMGVLGESWEVPARVRAKSTDPNASTAFQAAMDRCQAILNEVIDELEDNPPVPAGATTMEATVTDVQLQPNTLEDGGWACTAEFDIHYEAHVPV